MTLSAYFAAAAEHEQLAWMSGSTLEILVDSATSNGQVLIMRSDTTRGSGVPVHVHQREDEIFVLLNGTLVVWAGDQRQELSQGGVAVLPKDVPHTYFVTSPTAAILEVIAPGGLEQAFREAGWDLRSPLPDNWACTPGAVATAMAKVGCTILGPPPSSAEANPIATQSRS
jgi:quercetin dioxygenase-like cupin family protein